ncbi:3-deoxy-D-manno-octulosonic acid transferase [Komagataeibacter rhaeticus]|uniref:3-deoxy-D-manno-octulosonic acid transferase n=1 Tax=Komagataeibacter rhaeticus TaxID=215221 RepID=UPI0004D978FF|nr:glycosyltransferase N-terminal domain-containing protein [Komagataeibacter rhaeticus]KDU94566.1 3-deoxy-D-manno-octulosonic acid transferase [Komagataeibacter rhaeticus AF1]MBL7238648.1 3-deoxy-D-manno-octulosonic acid transferase [Komagataeibacter rhaeticus]PYD53677.1 3-deoxy-D-manno-octulosonic acid transferase [Komagataeibacter rhaeticus]GBQ11174.1 3-deoxy-D-manno-octulosonic-acid transferase [Komagataeibacter rhaeticus DSM 16663]
MTRMHITGRDLCAALLGAGWWGLASLLAPVLRANLRRRARRGREIAACLPQRRGIASRSRPAGRLIWLHASSVGENVAIIPVIGQLLINDPSVHVLVTTGTVTGAEVLVARVADMAGHGRVIHQFAPLDVPRWVARFLDSWRPDVAALVESELWPNLIAACQHRQIALALVNGRLSDRSLAGWRRAHCLLRRMLSAFGWVMARSMEDAGRLEQGGASRIDLVADLKDAAPPLPCNPAELAALRHGLAGRPVWIAASTHQGEEPVLIAAAELVRQAVPDALAIIIPRHPDRGTEIATMATPAPPRRALEQWPSIHDGVWIGDTLGETGLFYGLGAPVLLGNSLPGCTGGGHNPAEPAHMGCPIATGPQTGNFRAAYARLGDCARRVHTAQDIAAWVIPLLQQPASARALGARTSRLAAPDPEVARRVAHALLAPGGG